MGMYSLSPVGKLFFASLLAWIAHDTVMNWKVRGDPGKLEALARAIVASKRFQEEINKPGATVDSVISKLNIKNMTASQFHNLTGYTLPI